MEWRKVSEQAGENDIPYAIYNLNPQKDKPAGENKNEFGIKGSKKQLLFVQISFKVDIDNVFSIVADLVFRIIQQRRVQALNKCFVNVKQGRNLSFFNKDFLFRMFFPLERYTCILIKSGKNRKQFGMRPMSQESLIVFIAEKFI